MKVTPVAANFSKASEDIASIFSAVEGGKSMSFMSCTPPVIRTCTIPSSSPILVNARHTPGGTDTVVHYDSSHLPNAESELIVQGVHGCTTDALVIREIERILFLHAREYDRARRQARPRDEN